MTKMTNILVNCDSIKEAKITCKFLTEGISNKGISVKRVMCSGYNCYLETKNVFVTFFVKVKAVNDNRILGRHCNLAYGFGRDISLYLTRGKSEGPTLPLIEQIVKIEGEKNNENNSQ